ncbi:acyltransferase family protein [Phenylobacterium sp.]|uniref:acyltransferase family protein n=1 Tax=Phenylobacterium sp. TaxID=1871053 RepID=UPI0035AD8770
MLHRSSHPGAPAHPVVGQRFEVLDSWRGVCALLVAVFHLNQTLNWSLADARAVLNFDLFVDFFFVLSGFVIATVYEDRLTAGFSVVKFAIRRLFRIYPLHLATLAAMMALAVSRVLLPLSQFDPRAVFDGDIYDFSAIFTNLLLLQGIGFEDHFTWNFPSWSISAEFYTYLLFALIWAFAARRALVVTLALVVAIGAIFAMSANSPPVFMFLRCVFGFGIGVLVRQAFAGAGALRQRLARNPASATALEIGAVLACAAFIWTAHEARWVASILFALIVYVFALEAGLVSRLLRARPFLALGKLSYSIYMVHVVLIFLVDRCVLSLQARTGWALTGPRVGAAPDARFWGADVVQGDLYLVCMLGLIIIVAALTYAFIEEPGRDRGYALSARWRGLGPVRRVTTTLARSRTK